MTVQDSGGAPQLPHSDFEVPPAVLDAAVFGNLDGYEFDEDGCLVNEPSLEDDE